MCSFSVFFFKSDQNWLVTACKHRGFFGLSFELNVCDVCLWVLHLHFKLQLHLRVQETLFFFCVIFLCRSDYSNPSSFFFFRMISTLGDVTVITSKSCWSFSVLFPKAEELISPLVKVVLGQSSRQNRFQMDASLSLDPGFLLAKRWVKDQLVGGPLERSLSTKK